jgi:hypothetical protein
MTPIAGIQKYRGARGDDLFIRSCTLAPGALPDLSRLAVTSAIVSRVGENISAIHCRMSARHLHEDRLYW